MVVSNPASLAPALRNLVEVVAGSHGDADVVDRAFEGGDALFWLASPGRRRTLKQAYLDFTRPAAEALYRHGVRRIVAITPLGRGTSWADMADLVTASIRMDEMITATGVALRGLAMPSFKDNVLGQAAVIRDQGFMLGPIDSDKKMPSRATRDMGAVAATLLRDREWTGPEEVP